MKKFNFLTLSLVFSFLAVFQTLIFLIIFSIFKANSSVSIFSLASSPSETVEKWQAVGPFLSDKNDGIRTLGTDKISSICAGTWYNGVYLSENSGKNWRKIIDYHPNLTPRQIVFYKNKIYIAADSGIYVYNKGKLDFFKKPVIFNPKYLELSGIQTIEIIEDFIFAGGDGGVFYSRDLINWQATPLSEMINENDFLLIRDIAYDYKNKIIYAAGWWGYSGWQKKEGAGVFKSLDFGNTWQEINNGLTEKNINALFVYPKNPSIILAGTEGAGNFSTRQPDLNHPSLFISYNSGNHWEPLFIPDLDYDVVSPNQGFYYDILTNSLFVAFWGGPVYKTNPPEFSSWKKLIKERENYFAGQIDGFFNPKGTSIFTGSLFYWQPKRKKFTPVFRLFPNSSSLKIHPTVIPE